MNNKMRLETVRQRVACCCIACLLPFASADADGPLRQLNGAYISFPPIAYTDAEGKPAGEIMELTDRLAADSGLQVIWRELPVNRIHHYLRTGEVDLWPSSKAVPALRDDVLETEPLDMQVSLYAYHQDPALGHLTVQELLETRQLILIRGYTYRGQLDEYLANNPSPPVIAPNHASALELLRMGRGDYLVSFSHPVEELLREDPVSELGRVLLDRWPLTLLVSRRTQGAEEIVRALNAAVQSHQRDEPAGTDP